MTWIKRQHVNARCLSWDAFSTQAMTTVHEFNLSLFVKKKIVAGRTRDQSTERESNKDSASYVATYLASYVVGTCVSYR